MTDLLWVERVMLGEVSRYDVPTYPSASGLTSEEGNSIRVQFPHCDARILHASQSCRICAMATRLQEERERLDVSNTGLNNRGRPCPADVEQGSVLNRYTYNPSKVVLRWSDTVLDCENEFFHRERSTRRLRRRARMTRKRRRGWA